MRSSLISEWERARKGGAVVDSGAAGGSGLLGAAGASVLGAISKLGDSASQLSDVTIGAASAVREGLTKQTAKLLEQARPRRWWSPQPVVPPAKPACAAVSYTHLTLPTKA